MSGTHHPSIVERSAEGAHVWYRDVAHELQTEDLKYAGRVLRTVLHALRDRLTVEETAQLAAQLPTLIRGIYYEQWRPAASRRRLAHDVEEFLDHVAHDGQLAGRTEASHAVAAVAHVLHHHISAGEMKDVLAILPANLRPLFSV